MSAGLAGFAKGFAGGLSASMKRDQEIEERKRQEQVAATEAEKQRTAQQQGREMDFIKSMLQAGINEGDQSTVDAALKFGAKYMPELAETEIKVMPDRIITKTPNVQRGGRTGTLIQTRDAKTKQTLPELDEFIETKSGSSAMSLEDYTARQQARKDAALELAKEKKDLGRTERIEKAVESYPDRVRKDPEMKKFEAKRNIMTELETLLKADLAVTKPTVARLLAKAAGEQRLTDFDVQQMTGSEKFIERVKQAVATKTEGAFTDFNRDEYLKMMDAMRRTTNTGMANLVKRYAESDYDALSRFGGAEDFELNDLLEPAYRAIGVDPSSIIREQSLADELGITNPSDDEKALIEALSKMGKGGK